jgi:hypothetical protein
MLGPMAAEDEATSRQMLEACGFIYDSALEVFAHAGESRVISAAIVTGHTSLWVAQWITKTVAH